ncbi:MAG: FkbM family methyltransferase [Patescibacteria group bacterium]
MGAHHPKRYSNTHLLYTKGWRGINIDPNPHTIDLFMSARPTDVNVCTGIACQAGDLAYYRFSDPALNTFKKEEAQKWMNKDWVAYLGAVPVSVKPLRDALHVYSPLPPIDLMNIDVEGMDMEVLESNDWETTRPRVIVVESADFDPVQRERSAVYHFLSKKGYTLRAQRGSSLIFAHL